MVTAKHHERLVLAENERDDVVRLLQSHLTTLIDLALQLKQAHWNVIGSHFRSLHLQLDEIVDSVRSASDEVAERITTLGVAADGRASCVASDTELDEFPEGRHQVSDLLTLVADRLLTAIQGLRRGIQATAESDPVTQDLLIGITADLEKHLWMVQAQELG